jgi:pimeloyl-ACP methyl ester carboxylesterase
MRTSASSGRADKVARTIALGLGRLLALFITIILCLPIALLPIATSVPTLVWILLIIAAIALLVLQFRLQPVWRGIAISWLGMLIVSFSAVLASQLFASTPAIVDANGQPIPGSIATLEKVNLNDSEQWITIRGKDATKPVLLFLAGGPGGSQLVTARRALKGLEDHFVVVNWEQPGAGKSFDAVDRSTLTPERYIADTRALVLYLQQRFGREKIYLLGESWGSALGVMVAQRYPELFHAFIGTGQMVAFLENDLICYKFAMRLAEERGDAQKVEELKRQGPPPYYTSDVALKSATYLMDTFAYMNASPVIADDGFNTFQDLAGSEYSLYDKVNWFRGVLDTFGVVYPQLWDVDFRQQAPSLEVPVYFLIGRHDVNAPPQLTEEYYRLLDAPHKELIWFEHSGHNPWVSESDKFVDTVVNTVLAQTRAAR